MKDEFRISEIFLKKMLHRKKSFYLRQKTYERPALIQAVFHIGDCFWARENRRPKN